MKNLNILITDEQMETLQYLALTWNLKIPEVIRYILTLPVAIPEPTK